MAKPKFDLLKSSVNNDTLKEFEKPSEKLRVFSAIKYRNAVVDYGIVLGERVGRWELKKTRKPAWARNLSSGDYISETSPHKKDLKVYISSVDVNIADEILVFKNNQYSRILITKKEDKTFGFKLLSTWFNTVRVNHFPSGSTKLTGEI